MTLPADAYVPVPIRWRHVLPGDVFVDRNGSLWHIANFEITASAISITAQHGTQLFTRDVDPDDVIPVLIAVPERDAVELVREELGARLIARRTAPPKD